MKKQILISLVLVTIISCTIFISDGLTYLVTSLMAFSIMAVIHSNRTRVMKMTRWAKVNPRNAQIYISILQIALLILAIITGYNLKKLGYEFSNTTAYIFTAISVIGFWYVPFLPKRSNIAIPKKVNRNRIAFMGIALSSFVIMAFIGNRIAEIYPNSPITTTLEKIDQAIFVDANLINFGLSENSKNGKNYSLASSAKPLLAAVDVRPKDDVKKSSQSNSNAKKDRGKSKREIRRANRKARKELRKANRKARKELRKLKKNRRKNLRRAAAGGACAAAVLLIILLLAPLCAGICLIIGAWGNTSALSILGGIALTGFSVWGMIEVAKKCKPDDSKSD